MKLIDIYRGGLDYPLELANKDKYDSLIIVYKGYSYKKHLASNLKEIKRIPFVNTDSTIDHEGGKLACGFYNGILGSHKGNYPAIEILSNSIPLKRLKKIKKLSDLTQDDITVPSNIPNPTHNNKKIITYAEIHKGGITWDYSHGCITILNNKYFRNYWSEFINLFKKNEKVKIRLHT